MHPIDATSFVALVMIMNIFIAVMAAGAVMTHVAENEAVSAIGWLLVVVCTTMTTTLFIAIF